MSENERKMRVILFRGFHPDNNGKEKVFVNDEWIKGTWVKGNHLYNDMTGKHYIVPLDNIVPFGNITESEKVGQDGCCYCVGFEVIPETVGQYTGWKDGDKQKIFENDIVRTCVDTNPRIFIVKCMRGKFGYQYYLENIDGTRYKPYMPYAVDIIGNIYDNPEMLEAKNEKR